MPVGPSGDIAVIGGGFGEKGDTGADGQSSGRTYYLLPSIDSDISGYFLANILPYPPIDPPTEISTNNTGTTPVLVGAFATEEGDPSATVYPLGTGFRYVTTKTGADNQIARLKVEVYKRALNGDEFLIKEGYSDEFWGDQRQSIEWHHTDFVSEPLDITDRLVFKLYTERVSGPSTVHVTVYFEGANDASFIQTTLASPGPKGDTGDTGVKGDTGDDSTIPGPKGDTGSDSTVPGPKGDTGVSIKGDTGDSGLPTGDVTDVAARFVVTNPYIPKAGVFKGQAHCHTTNSDGQQSPAAVVTAYRDAGYNWISVTDHNFLTTDPGISGILFIPGVEETGTYHHFVNLHALAVRNNADPQKVIDDVLADNSLIFLAHPNLLNYLSLTDMDRMAKYYGVEHQSSQVGNAENRWDELLTQGRKFLGYAVDDCHNINGATFNKNWLMVFADSNTIANIKDSLKRGNFYSSSGATLSLSLSDKTITAITGASATFEWIGSGGVVLRTVSGVLTDSYTVVGNETYVRLRVTRASDGAKAWSNPFWVDRITTEDLAGGGPVRGNLYAVKDKNGYGGRVFSIGKALRYPLSGNTNFYVRTDGSDSNDGFQNTPGGAWLTLQNAVDWINGNIDLNNYNATINVANGTYSGAVSVSTDPPGRGTIFIVGNISSPSSVVVTSANIFATLVVSRCTKWYFQGFTLSATGSTSDRICVSVDNQSFTTLNGVSFSTNGGSQVLCRRGAILNLFSGAYTIQNGVNSHLDVRLGGMILVLSLTATLTGTPNFATAFASSVQRGFLYFSGVTWSGSATGKRYDGQGLSLIDTGGQATTWLPGNVAGTLSGGSQYV